MTSDKSAPTKEIIDDVLESICVEWGFCLSSTNADRIRSLESLTADRFADEVILAEFGTADSKWKNLIAERFTRFCDELGPDRK